MGEPLDIWAERIQDREHYQVNRALMEKAGEQAVFMLCLPDYHNLKTTIGKQIGETFYRTKMEVTDEVFEGPNPSSLMRQKIECIPSKC